MKKTWKPSHATFQREGPLGEEGLSLWMGFSAQTCTVYICVLPTDWPGLVVMVIWLYCSSVCSLVTMECWRVHTSQRRFQKVFPRCVPDPKSIIVVSLFPARAPFSSDSNPIHLTASPLTFTIHSLLLLSFAFPTIPLLPLSLSLPPTLSLISFPSSPFPFFLSIFPLDFSPSSFCLLSLSSYELTLLIMRPTLQVSCLQFLFTMN